MNHDIVRARCYRASLWSFLCLVSMLYAGAIHAHAQFKVDSVTPPRYNTDGIKTSPPCGDDASFASLRTNRRGIFTSGETITLEWIETINHGGSYIFDFAPANDQGFDSNSIMTVADTQNDAASRTNPHYYSQSIQLNFPSCEACTLRMRQDMENAGNYYYSCADIVIVSGNDLTPPQEVTGVTASLVANGIQLLWTNPADVRGVIVLRSTVSNLGQPEDRKDYLPGDTVGNSVVVYKGTGAGFVDSSVVGGTEYTYVIFAFDADYNYNSGVLQTITNAMDGEGNSGGGAGSWLLILLATLLIFQRPAWKKLL